MALIFPKVRCSIGVGIGACSSCRPRIELLLRGCPEISPEPAEKLMLCSPITKTITRISEIKNELFSISTMFGSRLYRSTTFVTRSALRRWTVTTPRTQTVSPGGRRSYMYRVINHQRLITSWNALRIWIRNPMFPYHLAGIGLFSSVLYLYYLERAPVRSAVYDTRQGRPH